MAKARNVHTCGWDTGRFDLALNVPHGHVTDRSNGNQQNGIDFLVVHALGPFGRGLLLQANL